MHTLSCLKSIPHLYPTGQQNIVWYVISKDQRWLPLINQILIVLKWHYIFCAIPHILKCSLLIIILVHIVQAVAHACFILHSREHCKTNLVFFFLRCSYWYYNSVLIILNKIHVLMTYSVPFHSVIKNITGWCITIIISSSF